MEGGEVWWMLIEHATCLTVCLHGSGVGGVFFLGGGDMHYKAGLILKLHRLSFHFIRSSAELPKISLN